MKKFEVNGKLIEKGEERKFSKEIDAISEPRAMDKTLSMLGSSHKIKRNKIVIENVSELKE
ncbi:MAG: 50S ribosomal protein L18Ae [Candidatus Diapherotrites archaeon]